MKKTVRSWLIFIICSLYLWNAVNAEPLGDYKVYWDMYENGSWTSFSTQPLFTLYFEVLRFLIPNSGFVFFYVILSLPFYLYSYTYFIATNQKHFFYLIFSLSLFLIFILKPLMFVYLLRQNLAMLFYLILLPHSLILAGILATGMHFSFLFVCTFTIIIWKTLILKLDRYLLVILVASVLTLLYLNSFTFLSLFDSLDKVGYSVFDSYVDLYKSYNDRFPDVTSLWIFVTVSTLIYVFFKGREDAKYLDLVLATNISILILNALFSFSDPISYRFLQAGKLPSIVLLSNALGIVFRKLKA